MGTIVSLFRFKGEIGRRRLWLTLIGIGVAGMAIDFGLLAASRVVGDPPLGADGNYAMPVNAAGWALYAIYWIAISALFWVLAAAFVRRLREVGIGLKWAGLCVALWAAFSLSVGRIPEGTVHLSAWQWFAVFFIGLPTSVMAFWIFGTAMFAPSDDARRFVPSELPEGWKK